MAESEPSRRGRTPREWAELGAYSSPFSGTGIEFHLLAAKPADAELVLHETGFDPHRPHWNYPRVFSPFWRLYYDFERGHSVVFGDRRVVLGPDRIIIIPDQQLFHTVGTEPRSKFWLAFSYARRTTAGQPIPIELKPTKTERALIHELTSLLWPEPEAPDRTRIYHQSLALLHITLSRPEVAWQAATPDNLQTVVRYVEERYASQLYVADLARLAHMSETRFRRHFKAFRHVSPAEFIAQVRVREAGHFLSTTDLSVPEIAERTGFPNAAYFSRVFRRLTGSTPAKSRLR